MKNYLVFAHARTLLLIALVGALVAVPLACDDSDDGGDSTGPVPAQITVSMIDNEFVERVDTVAVGGTVTWTNDGSVDHTSTSDAAIWDSGTVPPGESFSQSFPQPGTFAYHCIFHGGAGGIGMAGTIVVR